MEDLGTVPNVKIITAAIAYDDREAWHTYILFYHHALCIPTMQRHLLNPNQMHLGEAQLDLLSVETLVPGPLLLPATATPEPL